MHKHHLDLAVALGLFVPIVGVAVRAASFRSANFTKWDSRVRLTHSGLTQLATDMLLALQERIVLDLGLEDSESGGPPRVSVDPSPIVELAERSAKVLRDRDRLRPRFRRYCRLHRPLGCSVGCYLVGWLFTMLHYTADVGPFFFAPTGISLIGIGVVTAVGVYVAYAYLESKLAAAEELAAEET